MNMLYTGKSILLLLGIVLLFIPLFILLSFIPGPFVLTIFARLESFLILSTVYLILYRVFFDKILNDADILGEDEREERKLQMKLAEQTALFLMGIVVFVLAVCAFISGSQLILTLYMKILFISSTLLSLASYVFAGCISASIFVRGEQAAQQNIENKQSILKMAIIVWTEIVQLIIIILICTI